MKVFTAIIAMIVLVFTLVSVVFKNGDDIPTNPFESTVSEKPSATSAVVGGWSVNTEFGKPEIPVKAKEAFDKANTAGYTIAAYLGSQVVAGTNYSYLCALNGRLFAVKVYCDLQGNCTMTHEKAHYISEYTGKNDGIKFNPAGFAGGWYFGDADGADLPADAEAAFEKATSGIKDVDYDAIALLGSQVVAGRNFAVLCKAETEGKNETAALAVVIIYADLSGGAMVTSVSNFEF